LRSGLSVAVEMVQVVEAVEEAKTRIPPEYHQSFYGEYDLWLYVAVYDEVLCPKCRAFAQQKVFKGSELRSKFEYHEIADEDRILAKVHPHCRCELYRIIDPKRYLRWFAKLFGETNHPSLNL